MKFRRKISPKRSKKNFSKYAMKTQKKNLRAVPMRGGFRI